LILILICQYIYNEKFVNIYNKEFVNINIIRDELNIKIEIKIKIEINIKK